MTVMCCSKLKRCPHLIEGDIFSNDAEIYFDFNAPIVTNDFVTSVNATASIGSNEDVTVKVYPNPTNGVVNISASSGIKAVAVIDLQGRLLSRTDFISSDLTQNVDLSATGSGVYFLKVESLKGTSVQKVVVVVSCYCFFAFAKAYNNNNSQKYKKLPWNKAIFLST